MKKFVKIMLCSLLAFGLVACSKKTTSEGKFTAGTYTGVGQGNNGEITVEVTLSADAITEVKVTSHSETAGISDGAIEKVPSSIVEAQTVNVETVSGATNSSKGIIEAVSNALESAGVDLSTLSAGSAHENVAVTYTAGTYQGTAAGYNGDVVLEVTFTEEGISEIQVVSSKETDHVGNVAFDILFEDMKAANGSGVDIVSGATFSSLAVKNAVTMAAEAASASDLEGFKTNTVVHTAQADIDETYDIIVVGAGGAGMGAAAQAAQDGQTVVVVETNAEIGGNTLVSGGQFQAVMDYLVWDAANPEATEATWDYDGKTYSKVKATHGQLDTLKTILGWSEEPFDDHYFDDKEYVPGEISLVAQAGVHAEYLPTLQALKKEIQAYVDYADAHIAKGQDETELTLFSTVNLHIFQTYYGGLRQNSDKTEWIYGDYDKVAQFCSEGYDLKTWLEDQGSVFNDGAAITLIGALWYRENINQGCDIDKDGELEARGNWGTYFLPTMTTLLETSSTAANNKIMTRTTAENLIVENGKVTGVTATQYDGTKVTLHANKGVILTTGGYAANVDKVMGTNEYWAKQFVTAATKTTNRSSLVGSGITMGEEAGAVTTGEGYTQMMPISWIDNGNLAFGNGLYGVYINPTTGTRFVDESAERDVLSLGEFENGVSVNGTQGVFLEITNAETSITFPYPYDTYEGTKVVELGKDDVENRVYFVSNTDELQTVLDTFGMTADPKAIYENIEAYDQSILAGEQPSDGVAKHQSTNTVGTVKEDGSYVLDGELLRVRIMAPSTHHTMGGLVVDTERHCLDANGQVIEGLYAAGEVTGGIHAGNRLGGNAIVEIFVSGRNAAQAAIADNQ